MKLRKIFIFGFFILEAILTMKLTVEAKEEFTTSLSIPPSTLLTMLGILLKSAEAANPRPENKEPINTKLVTVYYNNLNKNSKPKNHVNQPASTASLPGKLLTIENKTLGSQDDLNLSVCKSSNRVEIHLKFKPNFLVKKKSSFTTQEQLANDFKFAVLRALDKNDKSGFECSTHNYFILRSNNSSLEHIKHLLKLILNPIEKIKTPNYARKLGKLGIFANLDTELTAAITTSCDNQHYPPPKTEF